MDRKSFLIWLSGLTTSVMVSPATLWDEKAPPEDRWGKLLPLRKFGKTGEEITMLGVGGSHVSWMNESDAQRAIEMAIEGGVRFFDTAEQYGNGRSERYYGKFLTPKYRDEIFLMTKTQARNAESARRDLEGSLRRLNTDYLDLWQIHSVNSARDVDNRIKEGVLEVVLEAKEEGKVRHVGFTGHRTPDAHLRMLEKAGEKLETCQMPVNVADPSYNSFILNVMSELRKQNYGIIAMKTLANGGFFGGRSHGAHGDETSLIPDLLSVEEALHFAWSLPVSTVVSGFNNHEQLQEKIDLARSFQQMNENQRQQLIEKVADLAESGEMEFYKA